MKNKFVLLIIFMVMVSLLITMNVIFHESLRSDFAVVYNKQQVLLSKGISSSIETAIDREVGKLKFLAGIVSVHPPNAGKEIREIINTNFKLGDEINTDIILFDAAKNILFTTRPAKKQPSLFVRAEKLKQSEVNIFHDMEQVYAITPIFSNGRYAGGIILEIKIKDIANKFLTPFNTTLKEHAWLMDDDGNLLYHPTEEGMISNNLYRAEPKCFKCHSSFELEKKVLQGPDVGSGRYIAPTREDKILAFSKINLGPKNWIICVTSPYTEIISVMSRSMKLYSALVVSIFATVFLAASIILLTNRKQIKLEKEAREAIILEHNKLDTIVSAIGAGLALVNKEHQIVWHNKTIGEWAKGDVVGENCEKICPLCPPRVMAGEISYDLYKGLFGKKQQMFQITSAPVKDLEGGITGVLKLVQDVTAVKKLEDQVLHSEKLAALGRLAAGVAHEIGNPLTSISSFVQILKNRAQDEFSKENLDIIHHHIQRISQIVRQMSQFSKLPEMNIKEANFNEVIESSLEIIRFDKKLQGIEIRKEMAKSLPPVSVDHGYLVQVLINLLLNAADAIENGGGTIYIRSMQKGSSVIAQIADTGTGIPDELIDKIFDPFFTTKEKGTGLGLPLSYEIIKKFGGDLTVDSQEGAGTVFSIILPAMEGEK